MPGKPRWPLRQCPIVEVEWEDSSSVHGWHELADAAEATGKRALSCKSVGYLWKRNRHRLLLVQSQAASEMVDEVFSIPSGAVQVVRTLAPPDTPKEGKGDAGETHAEHRQESAGRVRTPQGPVGQAQRGEDRKRRENASRPEPHGPQGGSDSEAEK